MLEALLGVGRAIVTFAAATVRHTVRQIIEDLDRSPTAKLIHAVVKHFAPEQVRRRAEGIAEEQAEFAEKQATDGRLTNADLDRIRKLEEERDGLRQQIHANKQKHAQETLEKSGDLVQVPVDSDELSAGVNVLTLAKSCSCGAPMKIRQYGWNEAQDRREMYWACTGQRRPPCKPERFNAKDETIVRKADPDLDLPLKERRRIWTDPKVLAKAHTRFRSHLGDEDPEVVCPTHLVPMKLIQLPRGTRKLLGNYSFFCPCVNLDGSACEQSVDVDTFPQVSEYLRRNEGKGIIDG